MLRRQSPAPFSPRIGDVPSADPVVVHMGWGTGAFSAWRESDLFNGCGVTDFAGSGVVRCGMPR
jgi:hypothetical protein